MSAPPKSRIHNKTDKKVKIKILPNKSTNNVATTSTDTSSSTSGGNMPGGVQAECQFELELCWVIQQLESSINSGKLNEKQILATEKTIKILKSPNQPLIKKRQVMRNTFGDYRAKMAEEEKKHSLNSKQIKFNSSNKKEEKPKCYFIKKSVFTESGDKNFKFNFEVTPDLGNLKIETDSQNVECDSQSKEVVKENNAQDQNTPFKFIPTGNSFKFNFNIDKIHLKM